MKFVALFTCASLDIGGWCTVKHRYPGYHVACPPWLMYWSKRGSLFSIDLIFMAGSWVGVSWSKNEEFCYVPMHGMCLYLNLGRSLRSVSMVTLVGAACLL